MNARHQHAVLCRSSVLVALSALALTHVIAVIACAEPATPVPFVRLSARHLRAEGVPAGHVLFSDAAAWQRFWARHGQDAAPSVDFSRDAVAGVFLGPKPHAGFGVQIVAVRRDRGITEVLVREYAPSAAMGYADVIVYPHELVVLPRVWGSGAVRWTHESVPRTSGSN